MSMIIGGGEGELFTNNKTSMIETTESKESDLQERARRKGRRGSVSAEAGITPMQQMNRHGSSALSNNDSSSSGVGTSNTASNLISSLQNSSPGLSIQNLAGGLDSEIHRPYSPRYSTENLEIFMKATKDNFLFSGLSEQERNKTFHLMTEVTRKKGDYIIRQGDVGDFFYILIKGTCEVYTNAEGKVHQYSDGSSFGELALMYHEPRAASVIVTSEMAQFWALDGQSFREILYCSRVAETKELYVKFLSRVHIIQSLSANELGRVADCLEECVFEPGSTIVSKGEADYEKQKFFMIQFGMAKIYDDGVCLRTLLPGSYFGEISLLSKCPRTASVIADTSCVCLCLSVQFFDRYLGPLKEDLLKYATKTYTSADSFTSSSSQASVKTLSSSTSSVLINSNTKSSKTLARPQQTFTVGLDKFPTNIPSLVGRTFTDLQDYTASFKAQSKTVKKEEAVREDEKIRKARARGRRGSISAECTPVEEQKNAAFDVSKSTSSSDDAESYEKTIHPKSPEQEERIRSVFGGIFLFQSIPEQNRQVIIDAMFEKHVKKNERVIEQGGEGDFFYVVDSGEFDVFKNGEKVHFYKPGSSFGELALMYNTPRQASVIATTDGTLWCLDRNTFRYFVVTLQKRKRAMFDSILAKIPILAESLTKEEISKVSDVLEEEKYPAGTVVVKEGDHDYSKMKFYIVLQGKAEVRSTLEGHVRFVEAGSFFGDWALLERSARVATVEATTDLLLAALDVAAFERLLGPCKERLAKKKQLASGGLHSTRFKYSFLVGKQKFRTNIGKLRDKRFHSLQAYTSFMNLAVPSPL